MKYLLLICICFPVRIIAQSSFPLSLNHLYRVIDSGTYALLRDNKLLEEFCGVDAGLPVFVKPDSTTSILYIRGKDSYVELMSPYNKFHVPAHHSGIGFSWDSLPFSTKLSDIVGEDSSAAYSRSTAHVTINNTKEAWYDAYYRADSITSLFTWYAIYNPGMLDKLFPDSTHFYYTRSAMLKSAYRPEKLIKNIYSIDLHCTPHDYHRIAQELELFVGKARQTGKRRKVYDINNCLVRLISFKKLERSYIDNIEFSLNHPDRRRQVIGNLLIENKGTRSRWVFH